MQTQRMLSNDAIYTLFIQRQAHKPDRQSLLSVSVTSVFEYSGIGAKPQNPRRSC